MKESIWLKKYESEVYEKRGKSNQNKKVIFIILPVMLLLFLVAAMAGGGATDPQTQAGMMAMVGVFAGIMVFAIIMVSIGKKKDVAKGTRENVLELLKTDEDVDFFDQQMNTAPIMEVKIATETTVFLTMDYVGKKYMLEGNLQYRFIRRSDVVYFNHCKTSSAGANPLRASYFFDIQNADKKVVLNGLAETGTQLEQLRELLNVAKSTAQNNA